MKELANKLNAKLVTLVGDCGHVAFGCETEKVKSTISPFLQMNK